MAGSPLNFVLYASSHLCHRCEYSMKETPTTHIATLCLEHGITELITGDRDFQRSGPRWPGLRNDASDLLPERALEKIDGERPHCPR